MPSCGQAMSAAKFQVVLAVAGSSNAILVAGDTVLFLCLTSPGRSVAQQEMVFSLGLHAACRIQRQIPTCLPRACQDCGPRLGKGCLGFTARAPIIFPRCLYELCHCGALSAAEENLTSFPLWDATATAPFPEHASKGLDHPAAQLDLVQTKLEIRSPVKKASMAVASASEACGRTVLLRSGCAGSLVRGALRSAAIMAVR